MKIMNEYTTEELEQEITRRNKDQDTWTDPETGLEWQTGAGDKISWEDAIKYAGELDLSGKSDWRLPTRKELLSLISDIKTRPCIKTSSLECSSSYYWSSTTYANSTSSAWYVDFYNGSVYDNSKSDNYYVRCVRGGSESII